MSRIRAGGRRHQQVRAGAPDRSLTANAGLTVVTELCDRLGVIEALDTAVGPIKHAEPRLRRRGAAQPGSPRRSWPGRISWWAWTASAPMQQRDSRSPRCRGWRPLPRPGWPAGSPPKQWQAMKAGLAAVTRRMLSLLPAERSAALAGGPVTIDLDTTDVEVYGSKKRGVAYTHQGQPVQAGPRGGLGRDRGSAGRRPGRRAPMTRARPRRTCCAARWAACRAGPAMRRGWRCAPTPGTSPARLARTAHDEHISFAIGAKRIAPLWQLLAGIADDDWHDAIEMDDAQVAVGTVTARTGGPPAPRLLIRRVRLDRDPGLRRPAVTAAPHPAPRPAGPADPRARAAPGRSTPMASS